MAALIARKRQFEDEVKQARATGAHSKNTGSVNSLEYSASPPKKQRPVENTDRAQCLSPPVVVSQQERTVADGGAIKVFNGLQDGQLPQVAFT